jgi:hypothetical protein
MNLRPTAISGVCNFVREGYVVKVATSGEFWFVRSGVPMTVGVGVGVPGPWVPAHPAIIAPKAITERRIRIGKRLLMTHQSFCYTINILLFLRFRNETTGLRIMPCPDQFIHTI